MFLNPGLDLTRQLARQANATEVTSGDLPENPPDGSVFLDKRGPRPLVKIFRTGQGYTTVNTFPGATRKD